MTTDSHAAWPPVQSSGADDAAAPVPEPEAGQTRRQRSDREKGHGRTSSILKETVIIVVSALVLSWLVKSFLVQAFFIPSSSMHDTLIEDDRILVTKLTPGPFDLKRGDIVVFKDPGGWLAPGVAAEAGAVRNTLNDVMTFIGLYPQDAGEHLVKRVIGLPGDHISCAGPGEPLVVNGVAIDEPYIAIDPTTGQPADPSTKTFDITVPPDSLWVMGDNRPDSLDSRFHTGEPGGGSIPEANVVGKAFVTVWPLDRAKVLHNPGATFEDVPDPS